MKVRAVIVSHTYMEPATRGKLKALVGLGCAVSVAVPERWAPGPRSVGRPLTASWGDDSGVRVVPIKVSSADPAASWSRAGLRRLFSDFRPDVIQIEEEPWTPAAATASRQAQRLGIPATLFASESVSRSLSVVGNWRRRRTLQLVRALVGGNRLAAGILAKSRPDLPLAVMPQIGITPPLETERREHQGLAIGFVGRLVPEKGLDLLFRACVKLLGHWTLAVVGTGPAQEELESLAERLGIAARVTWMGAVLPRELSQVWPRLDALVIPSRTTARWVETFNGALVEAMGHGVTVVGSDSGALPELIDTAGMVVPEDDVPALTTALQHLSDSPRERSRFGREGRHRVMTQYVDDAVARRTLEFWEKVVGRGKK